jgi:putative molybdopterin biosynthesis protein
MRSGFTNRLADARRRRGWTQSQAASAGGISRQSYAAIESGRSVPSTEVALRLASALGGTVEELFRAAGAEPAPQRARWAGSGAAVGRRVRLARVAGRTIAVALGESACPALAADGVVRRIEGDEVEVVPLPEGPPPAALAVVGCDPSFGIVAETVRRERGVEIAWSARGSRAAIEALARGEAHVAGAHLRDRVTGEANAPWVRELVPFPCTRIGFAVWEQALLVQPGNPEGIGAVADLARPGIRFLNREPGSGSRILFDEELAAAGVPASSVEGYTTAARGHLAVAEALAAGLADAGVAIRAAGAAFGLDLIPIRQERYELIVPDHFLDLPALGALLDTLRRPGIRIQVESLQWYDGLGMGLPV